MFSSFVANGEINLIKELKTQGHTHAMLLKRSWYFWLFLSPYLLLIILIVGIDAYLIVRSFPHEMIATFFSGMLVISAVLSVLSSILYLWVFYRIHKHDNDFKDITHLIQEIDRWDRAFARFFNSVTWNYFLLIFIVIVEIAYLIYIYFFIPGSFSFILFLFSILSLVCSFAQILVLSRYRRRVIDLEMDFTVVVQGKLYTQNQENMLSVSQVIEWEKVRSISISYSGLLGSFLRYGNLEILTEWHMAAIHLEFIYKPDEAVTTMNSVLKSTRKHSHNVFLTQICKTIHVPHLNTEENKRKVTEYLHANDASIKKLFLEWTREQKQEIEEVYKSYY